jgi:hypothetical protein
MHSQAFAKIKPLHSFLFDALNKFSVDTDAPYFILRLVLHTRQELFTDIDAQGFGPNLGRFTIFLEFRKSLL